ncbi:MAG: thiol reductant ABC exporter subunit CydD [Austwickia sp.]|nr:thiol reductant ABC exporter subunit CydD [Austwickia sp.]
MRPFDPRLLRLVPAARRPVFVLAALGALSGAAAIASAFALAAVVVAVAEGADLLGACVALALAFAVRAGAGAAIEAVAADAGTLVSNALRERVLAAYLSLRSPERDQLGPRILTLATQGANSIEPYVARYLPTLASAVVLPPLAVLAMAVLDWPTALIPVLTVPLLPVFAALIGSQTADAAASRWASLRQLSGHFLDVMRGLPTLVGYGRAEHQRAVIADVSDRHRVATVATLRLAFLSSAALELLATISVAIVAVAVGIRLANGSMPLAQAMPLILLAPEAYWPIRRVGGEFHNAADGAQALADIADIVDGDDGVPSASALAEPPAADRARDGDAVAILGQVRYRYPGADRDAVAGLDATIPPGLTVLSGPSGVGKTTVLELLAGLRLPTGGTVQAPRAHLMTQRPFLAAASLRENLLLGARAGTSEADLLQALEAVGLGRVVHAMPHRLDTLVGDDGFGLSAGQRARIALARAALSDAPLVLLDEPTAHLDEISERVAGEVIVELARTRAVVVVSHRFALLRNAIQHVELTEQANQQVRR